MDHRPLNFLAILSLSVVLSACAGTNTIPTADLTPTTVEVHVSNKIDCGVPPPITPVAMRDVIWDIMTIDGVALYTITVDGYKALGNNVSDWIAASKQMREQRDFYRECIARSQEGEEDESLGSDMGSGTTPE